MEKPILHFFMKNHHTKWSFLIQNNTKLTPCTSNFGNVIRVNVGNPRYRAVEHQNKEDLDEKTTVVESKLKKRLEEQATDSLAPVVAPSEKEEGEQKKQGCIKFLILPPPIEEGGGSLSSLFGGNIKL